MLRFLHRACDAKVRIHADYHSANLETPITTVLKNKA
jgi:hypothetical protein